jgi:hypothetical protein
MKNFLNGLKWLKTEILNMYSSKSSFFSKKRVESGVAFLIGQWGMVFFLLEKHSNMTTSDLAIWAGIEFAVSGYMLNQIQKEKKSAEVPTEDIISEN